MTSSDSASSSIPEKRQNSKKYGGAAVYEYKSKYAANYIRNTPLSRKQTEKAVDTNGGQLNIVSNFHTWSFRFFLQA